MVQVKIINLVDNGLSAGLETDNIGYWFWIPVKTVKNRNIDSETEDKIEKNQYL